MSITVDSDYYTNTYMGVEDDDIDRLLVRSQRLIDSVITYAPNSTQEEAYAFAICAQAEFMVLCGGLDVWLTSYSSLSDVGGGFAIGSFSVGGGSSSTSDTGGNGLSSLGICNNTIAYLEKAGLLYRAVGVW